LCYILVIVLCKERWVSISKRELKLLKERALQAGLDIPPSLDFPHPEEKPREKRAVLDFPPSEQDGPGQGKSTRGCNANTCKGCSANACYSNQKLQNKITTLKNQVTTIENKYNKLKYSSRLDTMEGIYPSNKSMADTTLRSEINSTNTDLDDKMEALKATLDSDIGLLNSTIAGPLADIKTKMDTYEANYDKFAAWGTELHGAISTLCDAKKWASFTSCTRTGTGCTCS